jgi:hypothetical protein
MLPRRLLATAALALLSISGTACARQDPAPSRQSTTDAFEPLPTLASSSLSSPAPSPTSSPISSPSQAALDLSQLVNEIDDCGQGGCKVRAQLTSNQSGNALEFVLVRMPGEPDALEEPFRMALFDRTARHHTWQSAPIAGIPSKEPNVGVRQDATGHVALSLIVGAHASILYVIDPGDGVHVTFYGSDQPPITPKGYWTDTPGAHAEDLDGDGVFELVFPVNDYVPDYAHGTRSESRYKWNGRDYVSSGCTVFGPDGRKGTDYPADHPKCTG